MRSKLLSLTLAGLLGLGAAGLHAQSSSSSEARAGASPGATPTAASHSASATGNEMPSPDDYTGLSRKVLQYSEAFTQIVERTKEAELSDDDWAPLEALVDTDNFERMGVFLGPQAEVIDWQQYKQYIAEYGAVTSWEGTLRRITEVPGLVILELEERNTVAGVTNISNTVTIYEFNDDDQLHHLDVYVMPLP